MGLLQSRLQRPTEGSSALLQHAPLSVGAPESGQELILLLGQRAEAAVRLAYHLTQHREAALDLSQEAFVKALEALPQLQNRAQATVWFNRILVNLCRDWLRRRGAERRVTDKLSIAPDVKLPEDPSQQAERKEAVERVRQHLLRLPLELREAVALVCIEGVEPRDAAQILAIPDGTLRWRLHEGRRLLKEMLERG